MVEDATEDGGGASCGREENKGNKGKGKKKKKKEKRTREGKKKGLVVR